jgi:conserved oligomeric Golgi complex subunit 3
MSSFTACFPDILAVISKNDKLVENNINYKKSCINSEKETKSLQPLRVMESDLQTFVNQCDQLLNTLNTVIGTTGDLLKQHTITTHKTKEIHGRCSTLLTSKDKLDDVVQQIIEPLSYFNCLDDLCARVGLPPESARFGTDEVPYDVVPLDLQSLAPDSPEIFDVLDKTAACLKYLRLHPSFRDSENYAAGFLMVEKRALLLIKNDVFEKLSKETTKILDYMEKVKNDDQETLENGHSKSTLMDGSDHIELLPPYTWWGNIGDMLRGQLGEITRRARAGRKDTSSNSKMTKDKARKQGAEADGEDNEHYAILHECQRFYFSQRMRLISDIVQNRLLKLSVGRSATELACLGCTLLAHVAGLEAKLFGDFFTPELRDNNNRRNASISFSTDETSVDASSSSSSITTTALVKDKSALTILLEEYSGAIFDEAISSLSNQLYEMVRPMIIQMMDMDELCDFICILNGDVLTTQLKSSSLQSKVLTETAHQLVEDAQERLAYRAQRYVADEIGGYQPSASDLNYPDRLEKEDNLTSSSWYGPLDKTLMCLAKIYRCVDMNIFEGIARQTLLACIDRLNQAASAIERRLGDKINANLFLIKHILVLREQISPFDINFTSTEMSLDFSSTTLALSNFVSSGARLSIFRLDGTNPLVELIASSVPNVVHEEINTKQLLETQLKAACEAFILNTTKEAAESLLQLLRTISTSDEEAYKNDVATPNIPVKGNQVLAVLDTVIESIKTRLPKIAELLSLYLSNTATEQVLFKPVRSNINEAVHRLRGLLLRFSAEERSLIQPKLDKVESSMRM